MSGVPKKANIKIHFSYWQGHAKNYN